VAIVVDSSVAACWAMPDEFSDYADHVFDGGVRGGMVVPDLFWHELRNVLVVNERRGRLPAEQTAVARQKIAALPHLVDTADGGNRIILLARRHMLTACDAAYLELATRRRLPLATLDARLAAASAAEGCAFRA
jgi:predicted nucleic acid-binding protein